MGAGADVSRCRPLSRGDFQDSVSGRGRVEHRVAQRRGPGLDGRRIPDAQPLADPETIGIGPVWRRVWALILKELLAVLNDRKSRTVIVGVPLMQLLIFPYASTFEVTAIRMAVFNEDTGPASHDLIAAFASASSFQVTGHVASEEAVRETVEAGRADIILRIGESFSADLARGRMAPVQVIVDGRNSNTALITLNYVRSITRDFSLPPASVNLEMPPVERSLYNPNLLSLWFILPGLVGILVLVVTLSVTAFSVAREKEVGTFEQLLVTPLHKHEIAI